MQILKSEENRARLLSVTRALSHDATFYPSEELLNGPDLLALRGALNDAAFSHRFHNQNLLREVSRDYILSLDETFFLEALEQFRYHFQGSQIYRGTRASLKEFRENTLKVQDIKLRDFYSKVTSFLAREETLPKEFSARKRSLLKILKTSLGDQSLFLEHSLKLLESRPLQLTKKKDFSSASFQDPEQGNFSVESDSQKEKIGPASKEERLKDEEASPDLKSLSPQKQKTMRRVIKEPSALGEEKISEEEYKVFTKKHDEIVEASQLASKEERLALGHELDAKSILFKEQIKPLAQKLYRFLKTQSPVQWQFEEEEGYLNGARLSQKIIDPTFRYIYKSLTPNDSLGTAVTVLVDNSGSMRGRPMTLAALSSSFLAQTLEKCGVRLEILGFTTVSWQGGKSYKEWIQKGRPSCPGRLNETRHIVYKSFETPWVRARLSLGVMLKEGILKENIDGEALLWAAQRLIKAEERRKILIVISDGASIDDMTLAHNPPGYLAKHLKSVVKSLNHLSQFQVFAIGIGHDVTRTYSKAIMLKSADSLGKTLFEELPKLFKEEVVLQRAL